MSDADLKPPSNLPPSSDPATLLIPPAETPEIPASESDDAEEESPGGEIERVSKLIAKAGLASRRAAEEMIAAGRVSVNGHVITEQGVKADSLNDRIIVDGHPLRISEKPNVVLLFHKPRLVMTTRDDPGGRKTVMDFLPRKWQNLHPVGRLDFDTSGVLLLTDDGELTHLLTHPSHGAEKVYEARVRGVVERETIEKLERGVRLDDGVTAPCRVKVVAQRDKNALVELTLREGRNRQVRRMLEGVGHSVNSLRRVSFAGIELEGLPAGEFRVLLTGEIKSLRKRVETKVKKKKPAGRPQKSGFKPVTSQNAAAPNSKPALTSQPSPAKSALKPRPRPRTEKPRDEKPRTERPRDERSPLAKRIQKKWQ